MLPEEVRCYDSLMNIIYACSAYKQLLQSFFTTI